MDTTIQISKKLQETLHMRKLSDRESYENVIWGLIEDSMELSEQTKKDIEQARAEIKTGKFRTLEQVEKRLGL